MQSTTLIALSPEEKIKRYMDINNISNSANYLDFVPNPDMESKDTKQDKPVTQSKSFPTLDFTSMVPPNPLLSNPGTLEKTKDDPTTIAPNPYAAALKPFEQPTGVKVPYRDPKIHATAKKAYAYYVKDKKLPSHVAAGIVGNLYQESALQTNAQEKGGTQAGRGIAQWDKDLRWPALQKWAKNNGKDPLDLKTQLDYVLIEPGWGDTALQKTLLAKNSDEATMAFGRSYERPKESKANWKNRKFIADLLLNVIQ